MIRVHLLCYFSIHINKKLAFVNLLIRSVVALVICSWYIAINIGHAIDIKEKNISFIKQISDKFSVIDFYCKA